MTSLIDNRHIRALETPFDFRVSTWWVDLDAHAERVKSSLLKAIEIRRSQRMTRSLDARRFLASRHALRCLLASYLDWSPEEIDYQRTEAGKLLVPDANIDFSLSRSQSCALIAASKSFDVGVDVEILRPIYERDSMLNTACGEKERQAIKNAPAAERDEIFLRTWVRKEACLKATGRGLTIPLTHVIVGADLAKKEVHLRTSDSIHQAEVISLALRNSAVAALAVSQRTISRPHI